MKSLKESLFDKDLMNKPSPISATDFWDVVFKDVYCSLHAKCVNVGWLMNFNIDGLHLYKTFYDTNTQRKKINVRLQFDAGFTKYPCCPQLIFFHHYGDWGTCFSDLNASMRWLTKKDSKHFKFAKGQYEDTKYFDDHFVCDTNTVNFIVKLMKGMVELITSKKYTNLIQETINKYMNKNKPVPGIVIDQTIMKKLIKEA